jgi:hypothetical protein
MRPSLTLPDKPAYDPAQHYLRADAAFNAYNLKTDEACEKHAVELARRLYRECKRKPSLQFAEAFAQMVFGLFHDDELYFFSKPSRFGKQELGEFERNLSPERIDQAVQFVLNLGHGILDNFAPEIAFVDLPEENDGPTVPFIELIPEPNSFLNNLLIVFCGTKLGSDPDAFLFPNTAVQIGENMSFASGYTPGTQKEGAKLKYPIDSDLAPKELVETYLRNTEIKDFFLAPMPFVVPDETKYSHTHIIAGSGHGKTQLLQQMILEHLQKPKPPALVIIDSQGQMLPKIQKLSLFDPSNPKSLAHKLIIVDPENVRYPPALNMFQPPNQRVYQYSEEAREKIENRIVAMYEYIFGAIASPLTQKQGTAFAYVVRLMLQMASDPELGATIHTLRELMETGAQSKSKFAAHIGCLDPTARAFFDSQFFNKSFDQTREQVLYRLYGLLQIKAFDRMFSARERKLDMFDALQSGSIVLVNTSQDALDEEGSQLFGRFMIALTLNAAFERIGVDDENLWHPAFLIIDEASQYFDDKTQKLLQMARKYKLGVTLAHQQIDGQLAPALRATIASNTAIKYAGGVSATDANFMARDMRCEPQLILRQRRAKDHTRFACYVSGMTDTAVSVRLPYGVLESQARMSDDAYEHLLRLNRDKLSENPPPPPEPIAIIDTPEPGASKASQGVDLGGAIEQAVAKRAQKGAPSILSGGDPGEPASDWKP